MKVVYPTRSPFRSDVEGEVAAYFDRTGLSRHASSAMYVKTIVLFVWLAASYIGLVFVATAPWQAVLLSLSLGCAMAGIGFNVQHDGGHRAYSSRKSINRLTSFSLDVLGGSSYFWNYKHNIAHHSYPNISGADDDIYVGPLGRLSPHDRRYWFHRFQHIYMWPLYALLAVKWQLLDDFVFIIKPGIASTSVPRPKATEHALYWLGKVIFFGLAVGVPLLVHPFWKVALFFFLTGAVTGVVLSAVFQLAHCVPDTSYGKPGPDGVMDRDWSTYQVESAANFGRDNRLLNWYVGGLNFQIEHHLFPQVCHVHYRALSEIVERVCQKHGVRYYSYPSFSAALGAHCLWLKRLGQAESQPASAVLAG